MTMADYIVKAPKMIVVIRKCAKCDTLTNHEINKEGWGDRVYGEAMRVMNEEWFCPAHTPEPTYMPFDYYDD